MLAPRPRPLAVPPKIIEAETSASLVQANEFEQLSLRCKVVSEPQSQLMWKREDGRSLDGLEQRFRHEIERRPGQVVSIDSSELVFSPITRQNAGAYLVSTDSYLVDCPPSTNNRRLTFIDDNSR